MVQLLVRCIRYLLARLKSLSLKPAFTKSTVSSRNVSPALLGLLFTQAMCQTQSKRPNAAKLSGDISDLSSAHTLEVPPLERPRPCCPQMVYNQDF